MKIFILEDDPARIAAFEAALVTHDLTIRIAVAGAKAAWAPPYDLLLLDHDLGGEQMVKGPQSTGMEFAEWLAARHTSGNMELRHCKIVIHSYNPDGAKNMTAVLNQVTNHYCLRWPFSRDLLIWLQGLKGSGPQPSEDP